MSFVAKIKKIFFASFLTLFLGAVLVSGNAQASWYDDWDDFESSFNDMFEGGDQGLSFTSYEGQLAELTAEGYDESLTSSSDIREFVIKIVNFALGFLGLIAVIIVIYGGVLYVTAAGEDEKMQKGKKTITYAVIGLLIVMGSFALVNTVIRGAGGKGETEGTTIGGTSMASKISGKGFNASAEQVRAYALEIFNGFKFLAESTEELKNIKNDAEKDSLAPKNLPSKSNIQAFLSSVKNKLVNMKSKMTKFSKAEGAVNDLLRDIDRGMDEINGLTEVIYLNGDLEECDIESAEDFAVDAGQTDKEICVEEGYKYEYLNDLFAVWSEMYKKYAFNTMYNNILDPLSEDYSTLLENILKKLEELMGSYTNIEVVKTEAEPNYNSMKTEYEALKTQVESWGIENDIDTAGTNLLSGLQYQSKLYDAFKNIQYVQTVLTANIVEGSAPLTVIFDTLGTKDPAGGSIFGESIIWDLSGSKKISDLMTAGQNQNMLKNDSVNCELQSQEKEEEFIGKTAKRCTFLKPGTYHAGVRIKSNEPTKYADGVSFLTIKVHPPTTKIELTVEAGGQKQTVMHYEDDLLSTDKQTVNITLKDAQNGVVFNAENTKAAKYKWDFGNGKMIEFGTTSKGETTYGEAGKYQVTLEVINQVGVMDRKMFTIEVSSVAARLNAKPANGAFINSSVTFDASSSKSDIGKIAGYEWIITTSPNQEDLEALPSDIKTEINKMYPFEDSGTSLKVITHQFKYPLDYDITVTVKDDAAGGGNSDEDKIEGYRVESNPPIALFDYTVPSPSQPGTVNFDGLPSYDPDGAENFKYEWTITPEDGWELKDKIKHGLDGASPIVKFKNKGDYEVKLKITDNLADDEIGEIAKNVKVDNVLDVSWDENQKTVSTLNDSGEAKVDFKFKSDTAVAFEIDFGDGESDNGEVAGTAQISHTYREAGKFNVKVIVYDEEDNENTLTRKFIVGGGKKPLAKIVLLVNGEEIHDLANSIKVSKKDKLEFDASDSKNTDGTAKDLEYSWNFGNTKSSSKKKATTNYKELSPKDPGYYKVKLKVADKDNPSKSDEDEIYVNVANKAPIFSSVQAIPQALVDDLITPVFVNVKVFGAEDPDGEITRYKWWYFDEDDPDEPLGLQITQGPSTQLVVGTRGKEGLEVVYGFGLEVTDSDGLTYSNEEQIDQGNYSKLAVKNGANAQPTAKFTVTPTSVFVGDKVTFTSASTDPDGTIKYYYWDVEGDGFHNNEPSEKPSLEYSYDKKNKEGYEVRLKITDDKGGEATSSPIKVYVDSLATPPVAAFKYEVLQGSDGMKIKFTNNSTADKEAGSSLIGYRWDFDTDSDLTTADSDGDGKKDNDIDSQAKDPERLYSDQGAFNVKLTVTDDQGNSDEVINKLTIPMANPPTAAFTYTLGEGGFIAFKNNSTGDKKAGTFIEDYIWDFDTASSLPASDSDGDGNKENDKDSSVKEPSYKYEKAGIYKVKLTVVDNQGNSDEVVNDVNITMSSTLPSLTGGTQGGTQGTGSLKAVLITNPLSGSDGIIYLEGDKGSVKFDFSKSEGLISNYIIDKNIYFDTDGNGMKNDDEDFKTSLPGTWKTNFEKAWGKTVVKLTVKDLYGNENSTNIEVKFK